MFKVKIKAEKFNLVRSSSVLQILFEPRLKCHKIYKNRAVFTTSVKIAKIDKFFLQLV